MPDGDEASFLGEFSQRLHSDDLDVVCDALSDYQQAQADTRWGVDNPYWPLSNEVLFVARDLLDRSSTLDEENRHRALSWSLTMVWHLGEDEDADRIAEILETTSDPELREEGVRAASTALEDAEEPNPRLLGAVRAIALDESLDARDRGSAIHALGGLDMPEVEALFVHLTESGDLKVQVSAAGQLISPKKVRAHREVLQRLVDSWPEDAGPFPMNMRDALVGFHSTFWKDAHLDDPALQNAHDELRFPLTDETCLEAFTTLLRSDDPVAVGIALDHYRDWQGLRHALDDSDLADAYLPEVLERAREVLRRPISPAEVSALHMIGAQHAIPDDADLLVDVLGRTDSDTVRHEAIWTAYGLFDEAETADARLVEAVSSVIFAPSSAPDGSKKTAIRILADGLGAGADDVLVRAIREGEPDVQVHAVCYLVRTGGLDRHRAVMEDLAESWEGRPPARFWGENPVDLVLGKPHSVHWEGHRLQDPDLHRAHKRLRRPTVDESYHAAMRTMLESGDVAAVGIALDHWWDPAGALARGGEEARQPARSLVLPLIQDILRQPPSPPELSREYGPSAAHLTALSALGIAAKDDLSVLADALESAGPLRDQVLDTVREVLWSVDHSHPRLVQALEDIVCDEAVPMSERSQALYLLGEFPSGDSVDALLSAIRCPELKIQAAAALLLARGETFEEHRPMIQALAANWPTQDVPTEVIEVRELLEAPDEE
ncbi:hypothetical protein [Actinomadura verrucosospora]|uniref:Uncharacterized protein n=1 Tax=Actinomadura verrucosospora TaxID=46165 RepID=A0A7D3VP27_ACTVE|nr:hypothetical protein [Actinomadura verrucosospora]QKG19195.1 hypothetical protein ACTIVE_0831 [Actinomadura verrucosospora]